MNRSWEKLVQTLSKATVTQAILLRGLCAVAFKNQLTVAIWQLPGQKEIYSSLNFTPTPLKVIPDLEKLPRGFIFSPFNYVAHNKSFFIAADVYLAMHNKQIELNPSLNLTSHAERIVAQLKNTMQGDAQQVLYHTKSIPQKNTTQADYLSLVQKALHTIGQGQVHKIVTSLCKSITLPKTFDLVSFFLTACKQYPNALVSLVSSPAHGTWLGASPELLVSIDENNALRTVALAGTQVIDAQQDLSKVAWMQKDIEEQAMVSRYIRQCFNKLGCGDITQAQGPYTLRSGHLAHLKTDYQVDLSKTHISALGTKILQCLHPTPAVCGLPQAAAKAFIEQNETYDRSFYSGFLGPIHGQREADVFVNLRCMQLFDQSALLYAGGGITQYSLPEKEWQEVQAKCQSLLKLLQY